MKVSYQWLKQYVDLPDSLTPEELALKLTMSTVEVEKVEKQGENLENIVVGKILKIEKHPNADKLKVCTVDDGLKKLQIVCGGANLKEGMLVAFAKVGAKVRWHGKGELAEVKETEIRGVKSFGMICASTEIGLGEMFPLSARGGSALGGKDEKEILDLSFTKAKAGSLIAEVLGLDDVIFEIDNKSMTHRPDLWGHYGLAREVAALYNKKLNDYPARKQKIKSVGIGPATSAGRLDLSVRVEDKKLCPRYMAVAIAGVKIGSSPDWMQKRLFAVGLRPINNIVDITNYILLDLGQPMHAFDKLKVKSKKSKEAEIIVRRAKDGEKFKTLDGQECKLTEEMLVIADEEKTVALAGVMGGENSEINDNTTTIIYESATFDATNIRKTALKLGLRTESSARFEKSLDPNNAELALRRAIELTLQMCPNARIASKIADEKNFHLNQGPIELSREFLNKKIGAIIEKKKVAEILEKLGFGVKEKKNDVFLITVPSWRATKDISIPEDLVEEVARIYGYGNIEPKLPVFPIIPPEKNELRLLERKIKNLLALEFGCTEVQNYSFVAPEVLKKMGEDLSKHLELANPLAKDRPLLRRHLIPNLLLNLEMNLHRYDKVKIFEIGKVFDKENAGQRVSEKSDELLPRQNTLLSIAYAGKGDEVPFYEASAVILGLLENLGAEPELEKAKHSHLVNNGRFAVISANKKKIGFVAEVNPLVQNNLGITERTAIVEIDMDVLLPLLSVFSPYKPLPLYPAVQRDIAFVVDKTVRHADIVGAIKKADSLIENVELFDVYEGKNLGDSKKSMAYHITYRSNDRTLTSEEADKAQDRVVKKIEKEFEAEIRR